MATGNMQWFRWHHGTVSDPKFKLVARKVGCSTAEVIAVWACVLEAASASDDRGLHGRLDYEAIDLDIGLPDGRALDIYQRMQDRGLVDGETVCAWGKRQPKREDETANDRKRRQREREHELTIAGDVTVDTSRFERPEQAMSRTVTHGHAREEERREEEINTVCVSRATAVCTVMRSAGMQSVNPSNPEIQKLLESGAELAQFEAAARHSVELGKGFAYALGIVRGQLADSARMAADVREVTAGKRRSTATPKAQSFAERDREAGMRRWEQMTGEVHPDRAAQTARVVDVVDVSQQSQSRSLAA